MKSIYVVLIAVLLSRAVNAQGGDDPVVLAYFPSWSEDWAGPGMNSKLREVPAFVNHLFLGFAKPNLVYEKGSYDLSGTGIEVPYDGCTLKESVGALSAKGIKVILSVGGETFWATSDAYNIDYQAIKDLVDDIGFAGIDWDFEPDGSFSNIGSAQNVQRFIDFFTNSRAIMPRSEGYLMACAPSGVGALGGQINDDINSPWAYANRNTVTGEDDTYLYNATTPNNGISLYGFSATGHMIPVMQAVGDEIDIIAFQGYNVGASLNRTIMYDSYAHYAEIYGFKIAAGVHFPEEPWGPHYTYTESAVANVAAHIRDDGNRAGDGDGVMIWQLLLSDNQSSAYAYMNIASHVLGGEAPENAVSTASNYAMEPYAGGATGCDGETGGGGDTYCGHAEYDVLSSYPDAGTIVYADCKLWTSQWWANPGEAPGENAVWLEGEVCLEGPGCDPTGMAYKPMPALTDGYDGIYAIWSMSGELVQQGSNWSPQVWHKIPKGVYVVESSMGWHRVGKY